MAAMRIGKDDLNMVCHKAGMGQRLDRKEAEVLYFDADLHTLAHLAHNMRLRLHPEPVVTYVGDRNINYSNVCVCGCRFCAFFKSPGSPEAYIISRDELAAKIDEMYALGGNQVLLQGGHHPGLPLEWYEDLLSFMRKNWPKLHIHAFSPPEIPGLWQLAWIRFQAEGPKYFMMISVKRFLQTSVLPANGCL